MESRIIMVKMLGLADFKFVYFASLFFDPMRRRKSEFCYSFCLFLGPRKLINPGALMAAVLSVYRVLKTVLQLIYFVELVMSA